MSNLLGVIRAVIGQVYVVEADGSRRLLREGDRIFSGEEIDTGDSGAVSVSLPNGQTLDLGRNSHWGEHGLQNVTGPEHAAQDVASLQQAIADGTDPTQSLEATAAGTPSPVNLEGGGGGHTLVQLDLTGKVVDPTAGFKTAGIGEPGGEHHLPEGGLSDGHDGSAPLLPPQVQIDNFAGNDGFINKNEINHTPINGSSNQNHVILLFTDSQKNTITVEVPVKNGHWTLQPDLSGLADGNVTVVATATDVAGRTAQSTTEAQIDTHGPQDTITIDSVTADNVINIAESHPPQTAVHGSVGGDAKLGDAVTLTVDGKAYSTTVVTLADGSLGYQVDVSTQGLLANPNIHAVVTSTDEAGNTTQAASDHHVDSDLAIHNSVTIGTVANDDIVNANEARMPTAIAGVVGGDAQAGDPVTVTVQGKEYHGVVVNENGQLRYDVMVPTAALKEGANEVTVAVTSHDAAGNEATAVEHRTVTLDTQAQNGLTLDTVAGDNVVNAHESRMPTFISGDVTGDAKPGDRVSLSVNGHHVDGVVETGSDGKLHYTIPLPDGTLHEGSNDVNVMVTSFDAAGNEAIAVASQTVTLDTQAHASLDIDKISGNDRLNSDELDTPTQAISGGVGGEAKLHDSVDVTVNGHLYHTEVVHLPDGNLGYSLDVNSADFSDNKGYVDADVPVTVTVFSTDENHNQTSATATHSVHIDNHAGASITLDKVTGDGTINLEEYGHETTQITGTVSGDVHIGDNILVVVNGHLYTTTVAAPTYSGGKLSYAVEVNTVDLAMGQDIHAYIGGYDGDGNVVLPETTLDVKVDLTADVTLTVDPIGHNNMINGEDAQKEFTTVTGTVTGDAHEHDIVNLTVNGQTLHGELTLDSHGHLVFHIPVSTADLMEDPNVHLSVDTTDDVNNPAHAEVTVPLVIDTDVIGAITVDSVTADNILNGDELKHGTTLVSGTVTGEMKPGDPLLLTVNGHPYPGVVEDQGNGKMGYHISVSTADIQTDPTLHASISVTDQAQNHADFTAQHQVGIDDHATVSLTVDVVAGDNILNGEEQTSPTTTICGSVGGDVHQGDTVHLLINGVNHDVIVEPQTWLNGGLGYRYQANTSDLLADPTVTATVTGKDDALNVATATASVDVGRDDSAVASITINTVAGDDVINNQEAHNDYTTVTGHAAGDVHPGDLVTLDINGLPYYGTLDKNGDYRIDVSTADLLSVKKPVIHASVTGHDTAGNSVTATAEHAVGVATIEVHELHINGSNDFWVIEGYVGGDAKEGDPVTIHVGGHTYNTSVITLPDGHLGYNGDNLTDAATGNRAYINPDVIKNDPHITVEVTATDPYGHPETATAQVQANTVVPPLDGGGTGTSTPHVASGSLTLSPVGDHDVINQHIIDGKTLVVRGTVGGDIHPGDTVTLHIGTQTFNGQVTELPALPGEYGFTVNVDAQTLADHPEIIATVSDVNGNDIPLQHAVDKTVLVDTDAHATIHLDPIAGDNVINIDEAKTATTPVTGSVSGDVHVGSMVTIDVNGHQLSAEVYKDPQTGELRFSKEVSIADLRADPTPTISVTGIDEHGNSHTATDGGTVTVDTDVGGQITLDNVTQDNVINFNESQQGTTQLSGVVSRDLHKGDHVMLDVNGVKYDAEVDDTLHFHKDVNTADLMKGHNISATATAYDDHGNTVDVSGSQQYGSDTYAVAGVTINTVSGDNILSAADLAAKTTEISGTVTGDVKEGDTVTITIDGGQPHTATVETLPHMNGALGYRYSVDTRELNQGHDPHITVTVVGKDQYDNVTAPISAGKTLIVDDRATVDLHVDKIAGDNVINGQENKSATTDITGSVSGDVHPGDKVTIHVNGHDRFAIVQHDMSFKLTVDTADLHKDGSVTYSVTGKDGVGNVLTVHDSNDVTFDLQANGALHINNVSGDNHLSAHEAHHPFTHITGTVTGDFQAGDPVTVFVDDTPFHGAVERVNGVLTYDVPVATSALQVGDNTVKVAVTAHDAHGNLAPQSQSVTVSVEASQHLQHAHGHSLSSLLGDSHDSLSFGTQHGSPTRHDHGHEHQKVDLRELAHELHDSGDLTQLIQGGEPHAAPVVHPVAGHMMPDSHGHGLASYSLDHLIHKPENITH